MEKLTEKRCTLNFNDAKRLMFLHELHLGTSRRGNGSGTGMTLVSYKSNCSLNDRKDGEFTIPVKSQPIYHQLTRETTSSVTVHSTDHELPQKGPENEIKK